MLYPADVIISDEDLLAEGRSRLVYAHPDFDNLLVKIVKPSPERSSIKEALAWLRPNKRRYGPMYETFLEYEAAFIALSRDQGHPGFLPMFYGWVRSNKGLGFVAEKIRTDTEDLAPTLRTYALENGLNDALKRMIHVFFDEVEAFHFVVNDLHLDNLVVGNDASGQKRLYLVDGAWDRLFVNSRRKSFGLFRWSIQSERRKMLQRVANPHRAR